MPLRQPGLPCATQRPGCHQIRCEHCRRYEWEQRLKSVSRGSKEHALRSTLQSRDDRLSHSISSWPPYLMPISLSRITVSLASGLRVSLRSRTPTRPRPRTPTQTDDAPTSPLETSKGTEEYPVPATAAALLVPISRGPTVDPLSPHCSSTHSLFPTATRDPPTVAKAP